MKKIRELVIDEQFELFVLIKNADVRIAKTGKNLSHLLFKIHREQLTENIGMPPKMK